jgi:hypothetical protein
VNCIIHGLLQPTPELAAAAAREKLLVKNNKPKKKKPLYERAR